MPMFLFYCTIYVYTRSSVVTRVSRSLACSSNYDIILLFYTGLFPCVTLPANACFGDCWCCLFALTLASAAACGNCKLRKCLSIVIFIGTNFWWILCGCIGELNRCRLSSPEWEGRCAHAEPRSLRSVTKRPVASNFLFLNKSRNRTY